MKKIFRNLKFGLMLCAGALVASCSDVDDAMNEIPYTRVLTPLNFEAEVDASVGTDIKFSWSAVSNADSYVLELFEAVPTVSEEGEETFDLPESFDGLEPFDMIEVGKDDVPYTVKNLEVDKSFWARVRGVSGKLDGSHWACLTEPVTTSAVRKGLNPAIAERTTTAITLKWDDADDKTDLTSVRCELVVPVEGVTPVNKPLGEEEIQKCSVTFDNLDPCTNYKFTLLFGKSGSRGIITAYTRPDTEGVNTVASADALYNALNGATGEVKLQLAYNDGALYDLTPFMPTKDGVHEPLVLTCSLSLYGESTAEGAKPVLRAAFTSAAAESAIHIEDLVLDGGKELGATVTTGGPMTSAEFINCEFFDFTKGLWSGSDKFTVGSLIYDNVYAHDINATGSVGGDFIDIRIKEGTDNYGSLEIKNSTFYACARSFLRCREGSGIGSISVVNCTFNQVTATTGSSNNAGIFDLQKFTPTAFNLTKCVFLNENNPNEVASQDKQQWVKLTGNKNTNIAPTCVGNIFYNVGTTDKNGKNFFFNQPSVDLAGNTLSQELALKEGGMMLEEDPCINSIAGKMYLKNGAIAANKAGDPRWWNATQPEIVRATELETVTEDYTWNFTEKTIFDTETIEKNTIIDNIRIYAPAEVVMSEGVTFANAATVNTKGVPTNSALAFKADGYGSVEVTALGAGITSTVQIIAGNDAYSINADGKPHKVVFGDLIGENEIYVLPSVPNITFTQISWIKDTTPEVVTEALATPEITWDPAKVNAGDATEAVASWTAVPNAASYDVVFNGTTVNTTETSYTLAAATVAGMAAGDYEISVVAKPTETSTKYTPSEAGKAKFKVQAVGKPIKMSWIFADAAFNKLLEDIGELKTANGNVNTTLEGLTIKSSSAATIQLEERNSARGIRFNKAGSASTTYFSFVVPDNATSGKLTITGRNPSSSVSAINFVASIKGAETKAAWVKNDTPVSFDINIKGGDVVYVYPDQGFWFQSIVFDYVDPTQSADVVWDFTEIVKVKTTLVDTTDEGSYKLNDDGTVSAAATPTATETLYLFGGSKKISTNERICTADSKTYFPMSYGGGAAYAYFNANGGGTLTVVAAHAKAPADNATCVISIAVDGTELSETFSLEPQDLAKPLCGAKEMSWEIPSTAKKVAVMKKSGSTSPDIYSITWTPAN
ncbi:MAG: hypothetical protein NC322_07985 [Alistipes senegalensis]|nr:hypothetical protein [Alistipes senegalensis]